MHISEAQQRFYEEEGYLLLPELFSSDEIQIIRTALPELFAEDSPRRVLEKESNIVRSVYGSHQTHEIARRLSLHPRLVEPAQQLLGGDIYIYQFKINAKAAFAGDIWKWHQDYVFWRNEDGMPAPRVISAVVFLDEVNEFNGPLILIPGSHKEQVIEVKAQNKRSGSYQESPVWINNLTADLKYALDKETLSRLALKYSLVAPKGLPGTVLFFHGNMVHGSAPNISPFDRAMALITFNSVENVQREVEHPRPEFLASRDGRPIQPLSDNALLL